MLQNKLRVYGVLIGKWFAAPALCYVVFYFIFNPDHLARFSDSFYLDRGDGMQNVWNFWWVDFSLTHLHQSPYFTDYLHFPHGLSLVPQTMNIFNGLVGIPLMAAGLSLAQTVNTMVVFSFVMGGVTMFWLAHHLSKSYWAALLAGFMFTFSSYHFAHAIGHMQLISLEWVPLFLLFWIKLLETKRYRYAIAAALALLLTLLCDYYYFMYSVLVAVMIGLWHFVPRQNAWAATKAALRRPDAWLSAKKQALDVQLVKALAVFGGLAALCCGPLLVALAWLNHRDPLQGFHDAHTFSLDALGLFIPGRQWYWYTATEWYNKNIIAYQAETSVYLGLALIGLLVAAVVGRKRLRLPHSATVWWIIIAVFFVLSLGPRLRLFGHVLDSVPLPYAWLEHIFPTLKLSGMPIRMVFVVQLAAVILAAYVASRIPLQKKTGRALLAAIALVAFIDVFPRPLPLSAVDSHPPYVYALRDLPLAKGSGVIDGAAATATEALYAQTLHQKPEAFGYMTRTPLSVERKSFHVSADFKQGRLDRLCREYKIRYLATSKAYDTGFPVVFEDKARNTRIYDLRTGDDC